MKKSRIETNNLQNNIDTIRTMMYVELIKHRIEGTEGVCMCTFGHIWHRNGQFNIDNIL